MPDAGRKLWLRYVILVLPGGKAIIMYWSIVSIVTCWEAAKFSRTHLRVNTHLSIFRTVSRLTNDELLNTFMLQASVLREMNTQQTSVEYGWQNCPTATSPSRNIMRREEDREMRQITPTPKYRSMKTFCDSGGRLHAFLISDPAAKLDA